MAEAAREEGWRMGSEVEEKVGEDTDADVAPNVSSGGTASNA